jgi:hypothetical protein
MSCLRRHAANRREQPRDCSRYAAARVVHSGGNMTRWALLVLSAMVSVGCSSDPDGEEPLPRRPLGAAFGDGVWTVLQYEPASTPEAEALVMLTSTDATTWTETARFAGIGALQGGVAFHDGRFVAVAGHLTLISDDGSTWTVDDSLQFPLSIAAGGGHFVVTRGNGLLLISDNGTDWYQPTTDTSELFWWSPEVAYAGDRFFVYGEGAAVIESVDGTEWAGVDTGLTSVFAVGTIADEVVAFGEYDCCFGEVPDGITGVELRRQSDGSWTDAAIDYVNVLGGFVETPDRLVALRQRISTSIDGGVTWQLADLSGLSTPVDFARQLVWDGANTLLVLGDLNLAASHDGGLTWTN